MERTLHIRVDGVVKMVLAWIRYREVFRGEWLGWDKQDQVRIFKPFVSTAEHLAHPLPDGSRVIKAKDWLAELAKGGQDDLDLRLHEVWWHGILGKYDDDPAHQYGISSNDMVRRAQTTTDKERSKVMQAVLEAVDDVFIHGL